MSDNDLDGFSVRPLCPFCSKPWDDDMIDIWADAAMEHGYYGDSYIEYIDTRIDITCSGCKRLIYRKETRQQ